MSQEELLRRSLVVIDGLQRLVGGELDKNAPDADVRFWTQAENLRMQIQAELGDTPDLLWQMMKERGAVEMCTVPHHLHHQGTKFLWPLSKDGEDVPCPGVDLQRILSGIGLSMDHGTMPVGRGWRRSYVTVYSS